MSGGFATMRPFATQIQAFLLVETVDALVIDGPAVSTNQHIDTPEAVTHPGTGNLVHSRFERCIQHVGLELLVPARAALLAELEYLSSFAVLNYRLNIALKVIF